IEVIEVFVRDQRGAREPFRERRIVGVVAGEAALVGEVAVEDGIAKLKAERAIANERGRLRRSAQTHQQAEREEGGTHGPKIGWGLWLLGAGCSLHNAAFPESLRWDGGALKAR